MLFNFMAATRECQLVKTGRIGNTAGDEQEILVCYCGTTACSKIAAKYYPLPKDFAAMKIPLNVPKETRRNS
jgi:hypothetical protein